MTTFKLDVLSKKHPNVEDFNSCWYVSDLWVVSFHAVIVFGLGMNLLFKSVLGHCEISVSVYWYEYLVSRFPNTDTSSIFEQ